MLVKFSRQKPLGSNKTRGKRVAEGPEDIGGSGAKHGKQTLRVGSKALHAKGRTPAMNGRKRFKQRLWSSCPQTAATPAAIDLFSFGVSAQRTQKTSESVERASPMQQPSDHAPNRGAVSRKASLGKRILFIAAGAFLGGGLVGFGGLLFSPTYSAKSQLLIEMQKDTATGAETPNGAQPPAAPVQPAAIETAMAKLLSRDFLRRAMLGLWEPSPDPVSSATEATGGFEASQTGQLSVSELKRRFEIWLGALTKKPSGGGPRPEDFEKRVKVSQEGHSDVISINFSSPDPIKTAGLVNRMADLFVASSVETKRNALELELTRISAQLDVIRSQAIQTDSLARNLLQNQAEAIHDASGRNKFTDQRIREALTQASAARQLQPALERQVNIIRERIAHCKPDARVLSYAPIPDRPSSINPLLLVIPAMLAFGYAGNWLAAWLAQFDRRIRTERDVMTSLGVPCAAVVPHIRLPKKEWPYRKLLMERSTPFAQSVQLLTDALQPEFRVAPGNASKTVMVTSGGADEGKTTLCLSLAVLSAIHGRRAVVVDFDIWPQALQRDGLTTGTQSCLDPGVFDRSIFDSIQRIQSLGVDYLPFGRISDDLSESNAAVRLLAVLAALRERYDWVFFDAPPLLDVADTRLLARFADEVLFLVKWESTRFEDARNAIELLKDIRREETTVVLTQVNLKKHAQSGYGRLASYLIRHEKYASAKRKEKRHLDFGAVATKTAQAAEAK